VATWRDPEPTGYGTPPSPAIVALERDYPSRGGVLGKRIPIDADNIEVCDDCGVAFGVGDVAIHFPRRGEVVCQACVGGTEESE
jgi:hypothetical protein